MTKALTLEQMRKKLGERVMLRLNRKDATKLRKIAIKENRTVSSTARDMIINELKKRDED